MKIKEFLNQIISSITGPTSWDTLQVDATMGQWRQAAIEAGMLHLEPSNDDSTEHMIVPTPAFEQLVNSNNRCSGKIKFYNPDKEFGFIVPDDGSADIFLHKRNIATIPVEKLQPDTPVHFTTEKSKKGQRVVTLTLIEEVAA